MKNLRAALLTLAITMALAAPALAKTCPKLVHEIDQKVSSMNVMGDKAAKIKELRDQGDKLHKEGKHAESEKVLREALAMLK